MQVDTLEAPHLLAYRVSTTLTAGTELLGLAVVVVIALIVLLQQRAARVAAQHVAS